MNDSSLPLSKEDRQLRHDIANDLNALAMSLEAVAFVPDHPEQFKELIGLMKENVASLTRHFEELAGIARDAEKK